MRRWGTMCVRHALTERRALKESRDTISSVAELDDLLEEGTLREVEVQFWRRYEVEYPGSSGGCQEGCCNSIVAEGVCEAQEEGQVAVTQVVRESA